MYCAGHDGSSDFVDVDSGEMGFLYGSPDEISLARCSLLRYRVSTGSWDRDRIAILG